MSGLQTSDIFYAFVFTGCYGTYTLLVHSVDFGVVETGNSVFTRMALASMAMLLAQTWAVTAWVAYALYDRTCSLLAFRFRTRVSQDEMLKLMDTLDEDAPAPSSTYKTTDATTEMLHPRHAEGVEVTLQHRNDMLATVYVMGAALFFTMLSVGQLDTACATAFACGLWFLGAKDCILRARRIPDCVVASQTAAVHKHARMAETWTLCVVLMCIGLLIYNCAHAQEPYVPEYTPMYVLTLLACAGAPVLIRSSPRHHHYMTTYELGLPVASFWALTTVYVFSATGMLMDVTPIASGALLRYTIVVSLFFPLTFFAILHALHTGYAISLAVATVSWLLLHTVLEHQRDDSWLLIVFPGMLMALTCASFSYMVYFRHRNILAQVTHNRHWDDSVHAAHEATASIILPPLPATPPPPPQQAQPKHKAASV